MASLADIANSIGEAAHTVAHADLTPAVPILGDGLFAVVVLGLPILLLMFVVQTLDISVFAPRRRRRETARREAYQMAQREQAERRVVELRQHWEQQRKGLY